VCVTSATRPPIEDVQVTVVHHRSFENNVLVENTFDWFAQDIFGNVWYFGEDTTEFPSGSTEGSWEAGVDDADAGFIMLADPRPGDRYYQEFARNVAEDQAKVLSVDESVCLGSGPCYDHVLLTKETSRLDPGVVEYKYYARDVGFILGRSSKAATSGPSWSAWAPAPSRPPLSSLKSESSPSRAVAASRRAPRA
jgi:hypothetical protein